MTESVHEADGIKVLKGLKPRPRGSIKVTADTGPDDGLAELNLSPAMIAEVKRVVAARQSGELFAWHPSVQPFLPPYMMKEDFENDGTRYERRPSICCTTFGRRCASGSR